MGAVNYLKGLISQWLYVEIRMVKTGVQIGNNFTSKQEGRGSPPSWSGGGEAELD